MNNKLEKDMFKPLSADRVMKFAGCNRLLKYYDIHSLPSYKYLFDDNGKCLLLFELKNNSGHWVCLYFDKKKKIIYFFDSYGSFPDSQLGYIPKNFKKQSKQDYAYLSILLDKAIDDGIQIDYNNVKLQGPKTATCGRWCGLRLLMTYCSNDEFSDFFTYLSKKYDFPPDNIVTILTSKI